jgi:cyclophilin family peptidyl-prolyl cis-trans isomerase
MPRKKHIVQTQKRRKAYSGSAMSADATTIKKKGAFRFFTNYTLFAIIGAVVMIAGLGITAAMTTSQKNNQANQANKIGQGISTSTPSPDQTAAPGATTTTAKHYTSAPPMTIDPNKSYTATIKTDAGDVKIELLAKDAPEAVNNFVFLAQDGFYNGTTFYRVLADQSGQVQLVQAGDPTNTGSGGPGYTLPFDPNESKVPFTGSVLAIAKPNAAGEPNNGSQFFITLGDEPTYDGKYTVFGKVLSGDNVLAGLTPRDPLAQKDPPPGTAIQSIEITSS